MERGEALRAPGGHVLVVDDQQANRELLEEILQAAGYEVSMAADGDACLIEIERRPPDCLVLDVMMPRMDGYDVCRRLKADPRTRFIPIVMLTALAEVADKVKGLEAGADDFLNKPVRREELLVRIRSLVRIKRLRDELDTAESIIFTMVRALESKDPRSVGHSERVAATSMAAAMSLGLPPREFEAVGKGGLLHDIGKLGIPEEVLGAARPLSPEAEAVYRQHPQLGEKILFPLRSLALCLDVVRHHHERLDGSGYPDGVSGGAFTIAAEIVAVANLYDDLVHEASAIPAAAGAQLRDAAARGEFHGEIVETFLRAGIAALGKGGAPVSDPWNDLAPTPEGRTGKILVCDDTRTSRELLQAILEGVGFQVTSVESGSAVLPVIAEEKPDLVLLDIRMPGLDGFDVCESIKQDPETEFLPVVLVTALSDPRDRQRSAQVGADDFLSLPVNRLELVARVRSLLRLRMYYRDLEEHQSVVLSLASVLEANDPYTRGHAARVGELAFRLAREMGLSREECEQLRITGLLHEIGKGAMPEKIIRRPGRQALPVIRFHHEREDGKGHPEPLRGEEMPLGARILSLADAYDVLTSDRSHRKASPPEEVLALLAKEAVEGRWDPAAYAALAALMRKHGRR